MFPKVLADFPVQVSEPCHNGHSLIRYFMMLDVVYSLAL